VKKLAALALFAVSCVTLPASVPPLGVSLSEPPAPKEEEAVAPADAGALRIARVDECRLPKYIRNNAPAPGITLDEDVAYGDDRRQKYDVALPDDRPKALVVIIHGGGWTSGYKRLFRPTIRMLATMGYAAASVEYRLASSDSHAFPAGLDDVRCAIRAVATRAGVRKTILLGASSGAHLAAMAALTEDAPQYDGDCSDRRPLHVDGAVLYYAPLELDRAPQRYVPIMRQAVDEFLYGVRRVACARSPYGRCPGDDAGVEEGSADWLAKARAATPSHLVRKDAPPMLILQGQDDNIVPPQDARDFAAALEHAGVPHLLVEVPGEKHGFPVIGYERALRTSSCTMLRFLSQIASR
jgi:acetyl esterase/lipase